MPLEQLRQHPLAEEVEMLVLAEEVRQVRGDGVEHQHQFLAALVAVQVVDVLVQVAVAQLPQALAEAGPHQFLLAVV